MVGEFRAATAGSWDAGLCGPRSDGLRGSAGFCPVHGRLRARSCRRREAITGDSRRARFELWAVLDGRCRSPWAHGQERKVPLLALTCRALAEWSFLGRHWGAEK